VPRGHVKCVPKRRITLTFAQVSAVPATVCKTADDSLPRFEPWTCHQKPQVKPGARTGASDAGERCRTPPARPARAQSPACRHALTSQDARTLGRACRCQEGGEPQDQVAVPNTCQRILPWGRLSWARDASGDGPYVSRGRSLMRLIGVSGVLAVELATTRGPINGWGRVMWSLGCGLAAVDSGGEAHQGRRAGRARSGGLEQAQGGCGGRAAQGRPWCLGGGVRCGGGYGGGYGVGTSKRGTCPAGQVHVDLSRGRGRAARSVALGASGPRREVVSLVR
jgi:hypothetical protein